MSRTYDYIINLKSKIDNSIVNSIKSIEKAHDNLGGAMQRNMLKQEQLRQKMDPSSSILAFNQAATALQNTNQALNSIIGPGVKFNDSMAELKAITGASKEQLDAMGSSARALSKEFGGNASDQLESYKIILSRLGPEIANTPEALEAMGRNVSILSKTMGGDSVAAVEALTTAMNQYGVDLSDPLKASQEMTRMMDIMAAGAQLGAAEVPQVSAALAVAGSQAKAANISFEETNAALQTLAKGSKFGAEAGTALRNIIAKLGEGRFLPKETKAELEAAGVNIDLLANNSLSLYERLSELKKIQSDTALMTKYFGAENAASGTIMLNNLDALSSYTSGVGKNGAALEQAQSFMEGYSEKLSRMQAKISDFGISIFNVTQGFMPYMGMMADATIMIANLGAAKEAVTFITRALTLENIKNSVSMMGLKIQAGLLNVANWAMVASTNALTFATRMLNAAFVSSPWGWVVLAIGAVVGAIIWAYNEFEPFRKLIDDIGKGLMSAFKTAAKFFGWDLDKSKDAPSVEKPKMAQPPKSLASKLPAMPSTPKAMEVATLNRTSAHRKSTDRDATDAITAGGQKSIHITLGTVKFAESMQIVVEHADEAIEDIEQKFKEMFARVLNGSLATVNQ